MALDNIGIGTELLRPDRYSGTPRHDVFRVTGQTRVSWIVHGVAPDGSAWGGEGYKVDKVTLLERGVDKDRSPVRYMTRPQYEQAQRRIFARAKIDTIVQRYGWLDRLSDAKLNELAVLLEVPCYTPLPLEST